MPVDPALTAITRAVAREHNALKSDVCDLRQTTPVYQRGTVLSVAGGVAVVSLRGVPTNPLKYLSSYAPVVGDDAIMQQIGTDIIILGTLSLDEWHDINAASEPPFTNGWANFGAGFSVARYKVSSDGSVRVTGTIVGPPGLVAFTLPVAPLAIEPFTSDLSGVFSRVDVYPDGRVIPGTVNAPPNPSYATLQLLFRTD